MVASSIGQTIKDSSKTDFRLSQEDIKKSGIEELVEKYVRLLERDGFLRESDWTVDIERFGCAGFEMKLISISLTVELERVFLSYTIRELI